jgi:putative DNA-invertase from lambdoid prophage Rac
MGDGMTKAAIWARVSTDDQENDNQLAELRQWAHDRGLDVAETFTVEDSAWKNGGGKGREFDAKRAELLDGARFGRYQIVLTWGVDRLSRRGAEDMLAFVRRLTETGCGIWSRKDPWVESMADPFAREILLSLFGTIARFESERRSERVKAGIARRRLENKPVGGAASKRGRDKRSRPRDGYLAAWADGGKRREAAR